MSKKFSADLTNMVAALGARAYEFDSMSDTAEMYRDLYNAEGKKCAELRAEVGRLNDLIRDYQNLMDKYNVEY